MTVKRMSVKSARLSAKAATLAAVAALGVGACAVRASWAFNPQPDPPGFSGLVGIVENQTARLSTANVTDVPVRVTLSFVALDGSVVKRVTGTLQPGHGAFLDLTRADVGDKGEVSRAEIRGVVTLVPETNRVLPPDPCRPTLEVFGANGRTTLLNTDFHLLPTVQSGGTSAP